MNGLYEMGLSGASPLGTARSSTSAVIINNSAGISTTGAYAHGILAHSAGMGVLVGQGDGTGFVFDATAGGSWAATAPASVAWR